MRKKNLKTTIMGMCLCSGAVIILEIRRIRINKEIDEFDRVMKETKRKEETKCSQIK